MRAYLEGNKKFGKDLTLSSTKLGYGEAQPVTSINC
jgi:hypothetical protein